MPSKPPWEIEKKPDQHFTVFLQVEQVTKSTTGVPRDIYREVEEVSKVTVRADSLDEAVDKAIKHLNIIAGPAEMSIID